MSGEPAPAETNYWVSLLDEGYRASAALRAGEEVPENAPVWVQKIPHNMFNIISPKLQSKTAMKPTPAKLGVFFGSLFVQFEQFKLFMSCPKPPPGSEAEKAYQKGLQLTPGGHLIGRKDLPERMTELAAVSHKAVLRVLAERPSNEAAEFFKGFARGLSQPSDRIAPRIVDGKPQLSEAQCKKISTLMVYSVSLQRWREIEALGTSTEAYDFLAKIIPAEFLGYDPERIRRMFARLGKKFKDPGRPENR